MEKRNINRLLKVLEHLATSNKRGEDIVLVTTSPYVPNLTLDEVKATIDDLKTLVGKIEE